MRYLDKRRSIANNKTKSNMHRIELQQPYAYICVEEQRYWKPTPLFVAIDCFAFVSTSKSTFDVPIDMRYTSLSLADLLFCSIFAILHCCVCVYECRWLDMFCKINSYCIAG